MSTKKKLIITTGVIFGVFFIINIVWFFGFQIKFIKYMKTVDKVNDDGHITYEGKVDNYNISISPPTYLAMDGGYLTISAADSEQKAYIKEDGSISYDKDTHITFYIWTEFGNQYEIGIMIFDGSDAYQAIFDKNLQLVIEDYNRDDSDILQKYIDDNREQILDMMKVAQKTWGFDFDI